MSDPIEGAECAVVEIPKTSVSKPLWLTLPPGYEHIQGGTVEMGDLFWYPAGTCWKRVQSPGHLNTFVCLIRKKKEPSRVWQTFEEIIDNLKGKGWKDRGTIVDASQLHLVSETETTLTRDGVQLDIKVSWEHKDE
jgi:hypothetical protein